MTVTVGAHGGSPARERVLLAAARRGDGGAFGRLVEPYRAELHAHCYRMLGSVQDAEDALQDAMLGAWRGLAGFEGRSSLRSWLYRIATNACLRLLARRPRRLLAADHAPAAKPRDELGEPVLEPVWVEPCPDERLAVKDRLAAPAARYELRESVELAFVAALQELPATQRAVLVLRDVLALPAADVAATLDTSVASVNSALQRARRAVEARLPSTSQQATLRALGDAGARALVAALVRAWERHDVDGLVGLLAEDVRFTMPPLPAWFDGREAVLRFFAERVFEQPWRLVPATANGQLALVCYMGDDTIGPGDDLPFSGVTVLTVRGREIVALDGFVGPAATGPFGLPPTAPRPGRD